MIILQCFIRFSSVILITIVGLTLVLFCTARTLQRALPLVLYGSNDTLHSFDPNCTGIFVACVNQDRLILGGMHTYAVAQWSPDGLTVAVHLLDGWMLYPVECLLAGENCHPKYLEPQPDDFRIAWGPQGSAMAMMLNQGSQLAIRSRGCWEDVPETCVAQDTVLMNTDQIVQSGLTQPAWSADGSRLAFISVSNTLHTMDAACLNVPESCRFELKTLPLERSLTFWPSLSADGRTVLYFAIVPNQTITEVYIRDVATGRGERLSKGGQSSVVPEWTPDGRYVLYSAFSRYGAVGDWNIIMVDRARGLYVQVTRTPARDMYASWGPY